jgi:hypothetical protein
MNSSALETRASQCCDINTEDTGFSLKWLANVIGVKDLKFSPHLYLFYEDLKKVRTTCLSCHIRAMLWGAC